MYPAAGKAYLPCGWHGIYLNVKPAILVQGMFTSVDSFALLAVPFFIIAGEVMGRGGISGSSLLKICGETPGGTLLYLLSVENTFGGNPGSCMADNSYRSILIPMVKEEVFGGRAVQCC